MRICEQAAHKLWNLKRQWRIFDAALEGNKLLNLSEFGIYIPSFPHRAQSSGLWLWTIIVAVSTDASAFYDPESMPTRDQLIAVCRHREQAVRSAECVWELEAFPTEPAQVPLIKDAVGRREPVKPDEYMRFIYTPDLAKSECYVARWWRKGIKERLETFRWESDAVADPESTAAFDGSVIRTLARNGNGMIDSGEQHWLSVNRVQPFAFVFEFGSEPYSNLIEAAPDLNIVSSSRGDEAYVEASFQCASDANCRLVLVFDRWLRIIGRDIFFKMSFDKAVRVYERHRLSDYEKFTDVNGNGVEFPRLVDIRYYAGNTSEGLAAEYKRDRVRIRSIVFNPEIADDCFTLSFPPDANVFDGLQTESYLSEINKPSPASAPRNRQLWIIFATNGLLLVVAGLLVFVRYRTKVARLVRGRS